MSLSAEQKAMIAEIRQAEKDFDRIAQARLADAFRKTVDLLRIADAKGQINNKRRLKGILTEIMPMLDTANKQLARELIAHESLVIETATNRTAFAIDNVTKKRLSFSLVTREQVAASIRQPANYQSLIIGTTIDGEFIPGKMDVTRYRALMRQREIVTNGIITGQPLKKIEQELTKAYDTNVGNIQATARTETTRNMATAQAEIFDEAEAQGIVLKRVWIATEDMRTRSSHEALDGKAADDNGYWHIGGDRAKGPGLFALPQNSINCRCAIIAELAGIDEIPQEMSYEEWIEKNIK